MAWTGKHGRTAEPPPRLAPADPDRIAAALAAESARNPAWTHAVVWRTRGRPFRMEINGGLDYDLFAGPRQADDAMDRPRSDIFADPELWERRRGEWHPAALRHGRRRGEA